MRATDVSRKSRRELLELIGRVTEQLIVMGSSDFASDLLRMVRALDVDTREALEENAIWLIGELDDLDCYEAFGPEGWRRLILEED
jgi:hypothetical protein